MEGGWRSFDPESSNALPTLVYCRQHSTSCAVSSALTPVTDQTSPSSTERIRRRLSHATVSQTLSKVRPERLGGGGDLPRLTY